MPLLMSPVTGEPMKQIVRNGIEIDVCPTTGGVWLDKGELEKLLAIFAEAAREEQGIPPPRSAAARQDDRYDDRRPAYRRDDDGDDDDDDYKRRQSGYRDGDQYKKKSGMKRVLDIFDF